jgi:hypothetical protein
MLLANTSVQERIIVFIVIVTLMMEAVNSLETSVGIYQATERNVSENNHLPYNLKAVDYPPPPHTHIYIYRIVFYFCFDVWSRIFNLLFLMASLFNVLSKFLFYIFALESCKAYAFQLALIINKQLAWKYYRIFLYFHFK